MGEDSGQSRRTAGGGTSHVGEVENPLDFLAEVHMRERQVCALIDRIVASGAMQDAEIDEVLTFLEDQLPQHLVDEEIDLFPLMLKRCDPEDQIDIVIDELRSDHSHAIADAPAIVAIMRGLDRTSPGLSPSDCRQMMEFAHHARRHLILENAVILPIARARLSRKDLRMMKKHMLERRGLQHPLEQEQC